MKASGAGGRGSRLAYLYLILTTSIWGSLYVATRIALKTIPPITLLSLRYILAFATLASILAARRRGGEKIESVAAGDRKYLVLVGVVGYFLGVGAQVVGTKYAGASVASLINAMNPVCITAFAAIMLRERLSARKIVALVALVAAVAGAYVILGGSGGGGAAIGIAFSILSVILWSLSSVVVRRLGGAYDPMLITAWGIGIACACSLPAAGIELALSPAEGMLSWTNLACVLYLGIVCTALPNFLWNKSLSMLEASTCSLFYPLQPLVSVALGTALLGERVDAKFVLGTALIIGGILFSVMRPRVKSA
jgi:Permeases of the drug/metabolite transporter (DMT) superfamily